MERRIIISCRMVELELNRVLEEEQVFCPVLYVPAALHLEPAKLREYLQEQIDSLGNVDQILLTISGCGGASAGLRATTAELVLPRCADCIDLMLTKDCFRNRERSRTSMFLTENWLEASENFEGSYLEAEARYGTEAANEMLRMLYRDYESYDLIDTGAYDVENVKDYIAPRAEAIQMKIRTVQGACTPLRKLVTGCWDEDFMIVPKGGTVDVNQFLILP